MNFSLEGVNKEPNIFLIPPYAFDHEAEETLEIVKPLLFVKQLEEWCLEPSFWPELKPKEIDTWFTFQLASCVSDLVENDPARELY